MKSFKFSNTAVIFGCVFLSLLFFLVDLRLPWAVGSILYLFVIILALQSTRRRIVYFFAACISFLTVIAFLMNPPAAQMLRVLTNHFLVLLIIWITAALGYQFKRKLEVSGYLASIVDSTNDVVIGKSLDGIIRSWNPAAEEIYGFNAKEIVGRPAAAIVPSKKLDEHNEFLERVRRGEKIENHETLRRKKSGEDISVSLSLSPIKDTFGNIIGISSIYRDISEQLRVREKERRLKEKIMLEKFRLEEVLTFEESLSSLHKMDQMIDFVVERTAKLLEVNRCSLMMLDEKSDELCIKGYKGLDEEIVKRSRVKLGEPVAGVIAQEGKAASINDIETDERFFSWKNRPFYRSKSFMSAPIKLKGQVIGLLNVADKVSAENNKFTAIDLKILSMIVRQLGVALENARLSRELNYIAATDPLTGLHNFRYFTQKLDEEICRAQRYGRPLALLVIDIDDFKRYNDELGTKEGDRLLKRVADLLKDGTRFMEPVCHYSADKFVVILPETENAGAKKLAEKIKEQVGSGSFKMPVTVSIGSAQYAKKMSRHDLILKAEAALFEAKKRGKNRVYSLV